MTTHAGSLKRLQMKDESLGSPGDHQVQVAVKAIGLNFADIFALLGLYSATPKGPFIPGLEFAGQVTQIGNQVTEWNIGNRVIGMTRFGGYVSRINIDANSCIEIPRDWTFAQGASYLVQTLTAWYALRTLANAQPGENVLIHSAAGGVGLQAMSICKRLGLHPIGTVGRESKLEFLHQLGYQDVIVRHRSFPEDLQRLLDGCPLNIVLDAIGGKVQKQSYNLLAPRGRLIVFGAAEHMSQGSRPAYLRSLWQYFTRPKYDVLEMISANKAVIGFNLIWLCYEIQLMRALLVELDQMQLAAPYIGKIFPFEEAPAAISYLQSGHSLGKVLLEVKS
ncbi:MAG: zinc-binding dehydrogenase [Oligoflexus sp.]